jgi:hypothetical protein
VDKRIQNLINNWQKRNIEGLYCQGQAAALNKLLELIPQTASIGISGSLTLDQLGVISCLEARGNHVFNQYKAGINQEESMALRRQSVQADYYLASANAISEGGELVFFSGYGNRTAGVAGAKKVIVVAGINKITPNLEEALKRARGYATPINCKRLNWDSACLKGGICRTEICFLPEYKRMCCQVLIIEAEATAGRLKVVLAGEDLGF